MFKYVTGNLLQANAEALVNTVNTVGVMGKGIALQFKEKFQENYKIYKQAVDQNLVAVGKVLTVPTNRMDGVKWIINFPTKKHWRQPSKLDYISTGLDNLAKVIEEKNIQSIAMPPLGCGNGGLEWSVVKPLIERKLLHLKDVEIIIYEPSDIAYQQERNKNKKKPALTPIRAMILYLMKSYAQWEYSLTLLESQKLVYFLQRLGDEEARKIEFKKHLYGPYAAILNHVLYDMDGFYLTGMKYKDVKTFDVLNVLDAAYPEVQEFISSNATYVQQQRVDVLLQLIAGFETPLSMEILSTVDYVMKFEAKDKTNLDEVTHKVQSWNDRKKTLFLPVYISIAHERLMQFQQQLYN